MRPEIPMHSGKMFNFSKLNFEDVTPLDLLVPLSRMPRWGGSGDRPLTVLQHTLLVDSLFYYNGYGWEVDICYACMCHDLLEALYHDIRSPLKELLPDYNRLYAEAESKFYELVGVDPNAVQHVKPLDQLALIIEQRFAYPHIPPQVWGWDTEMSGAFAEYRKSPNYYDSKWEHAADLPPDVAVVVALRRLRRYARLSNRGITFWGKENG